MVQMNLQWIAFRDCPNAVLPVRKTWSACRCCRWGSPAKPNSDFLSSSGDARFLWVFFKFQLKGSPWKCLPVGRNVVFIIRSCLLYSWFFFNLSLNIVQKEKRSVQTWDFVHFIRPWGVLCCQTPPPWDGMYLRVGGCPLNIEVH